MKSVRLRLTIWMTAVLAVILLAMAILVRWRVYANALDELDSKLASSVSTIRSLPDAAAPAELKGLPHVEIGHDTKELRFNQNRLVEVLKTPSVSLSLENEWPAPRIVPIENGKPPPHMPPVDDPTGVKEAIGGKRTFRDFVQKGLTMRSCSIPFVQRGKVVAVVQSVLPKAPVLRQVQELDRALIMSIPAGLALAALGGFLLVGSAMRPLRRLIEASRLLESDLSERRLPVEGGDEFAALANSLNEALERTANAFAVQKRSLEQLERFTADAGHELRTPLGAIKGSSSYLLHLTEVPESERPSLCMIDRSADRMAKLIDDLLLLARHDSGRYEIRRDEILVRDLVTSALEEIEAKALPGQGPGPPVDIRIPDDLCVVTDESGLHRIVTNLLSNALCYGRGHVTVSAGVEGELLEIVVEDDGEGIPPEHLARLGERFYRPDESRTRDSGGSGLGLAIVKSLCEDLGGSLTMNSQLDHGTRATVAIPTQRVIHSRNAPDELTVT